MTNRFTGLDAIRGLAATVVVISHVFMINGTALSLYVPFDVDKLARLSVIIFFVLSGFVLTLSYNFERPNYFSFLVKRFCRIYLPFAAATILFAIPYNAVISSRPNLRLGVNFWTYDLTVPAFIGHLFMSGMRGTGFLNVPIWSLIIEMRASILFPILLTVAMRFRWLTIVIAPVLCVLAGKIFVNIGGENFFEANSFMSAVVLTSYYFSFFLVGIFLALKRTALIATFGLVAKWTHVVVFCGVYPVALIMLNKFIMQDILYATIASHAILCCVAMPTVNKALSTPILAWLGKISFSLYLIHLPIMMYAVYLLNPMVPVLAASLISLPVVFAMAQMYNFIVEQPTMKLGKLLAAPSSPRATK
ncbi:acyltransferase [Asticcacaulis sp. 201]|uniref:acyltransferase family protein n=1 Tax=Asticcacaulis sp. 201 TaxID=3028787 RepID=UPI0029161F66|nr:acyltransferase [Asticcacaulis sp. 201]MDV6331092.1 acyltransferase [Asticcacaulis sp. 201]